MLGRLLGCYTMYTVSEEFCWPSAKFTLGPSLALSYIGSVTTRHSNSGRQPNFAVMSRGRHLYSAGRPSRWALAHILVIIIIIVEFIHKVHKETVANIAKTKHKGDTS